MMFTEALLKSSTIEHAERSHNYFFVRIRDEMVALLGESALAEAERKSNALIAAAKQQRGEGET